MTDTEQSIDSKKMSDHELYKNIPNEAEEILSTKLATQSNEFSSNDREMENLVEISKSTESVPTNISEEESCSINESTASVTDITLTSKESTDKSPEDEWLDIMGSGNFKKKIIKPGLGPDSRPQRGDMVTVDVEFYVTGSLFEEKQNLKFIVGDLAVIHGLDLVVCLMEKEEKAKVIIPARLAYGKKGRQPDVPEDADIECDVELKEVETHDNDSLTVSERLRFGNEKRERGNYFYERSEYLEAIHCYEKAAEYLDGIRDCSGTSTEESQEIVDIRIKVYNNMAASHLKLSAYDSALKSVELVLKVQPKNVKALFRKAKILGEQGSTEDAIACIKIAATLEPNTKIIHTELTRLLHKKKREEQSQRAMYQRMFPQSEPKKQSSVSKLFKWSMVTGGGVLAVAVGMAAYRQFHGRLFSIFF